MARHVSGVKKRKRWQIGKAPSESAWRRVYKIEAHTRQDARCPYCTYQIPMSQSTAEHKMPVIRGGQTRPENIDSACFECNQAKGSWTKEEWLRKILHPSYERDSWNDYLNAMTIRLKRRTQLACKRIASIR